MSKIKHKYWLIRKHVYYSTMELCRLLKVDESTVRGWCRKGLAFSGRNPKIFRGETVRVFLQEARKSSRVRLPDNGFYCVRCRSAIIAAIETVYATITGERLGSSWKALITAECPDCGTATRRFASSKTVASWIKMGWLFREHLDLQTGGVNAPLNPRFEDDEYGGKNE